MFLNGQRSYRAEQEAAGRNRKLRDGAGNCGTERKQRGGTGSSGAELEAAG